MRRSARSYHLGEAEAGQRCDASSNEHRKVGLGERAPGSVNNVLGEREIGLQIRGIKRDREGWRHLVLQRGSLRRRHCSLRRSVNDVARNHIYSHRLAAVRCRRPGHGQDVNLHQHQDTGGQNDSLCRAGWANEPTTKSLRR